MPIYEFRCTHCKRKFRKLVGMVASPAPLQCPHCQSVELDRLISRFARVRSEDDTFDALSDEMESAGDTDDPRVMKRLMHDMGSAMDDDLSDEYEQMMDGEEGDDAGGGSDFDD